MDDISRRDELEEKVRLLCSPSAYPRGPDGVEAIETHMSWVFLAGGEAYKLKKPVRTAWLDFSTPEARRADCMEEVRLNARLAPGVYLGVVPLVRAGDGLLLGGDGRPVDWLVRMRRLHRDSMMDQVILRGGLTPPRLEAVAARLAGFHGSLSRVDIAPESYRDRFIRQHAVNVDVLEGSRDLLEAGDLDEAVNAARRFLESHADMLAGRAASGMVVEGHGDLRPEHIFLNGTPMVIDCLEFNRFLRLVDPYEEIACLGLECARLGAGWAIETLAGAYREMLGGAPDPELMAFHALARALLRAQLAMSRMWEPGPHPPEHWPGTANAYLGLARDAARLLTSTEAR
ncbi:MAG: phosphotransferase [Thermodesulfobacteriota bacterium]|jgi:aminoglycoside phosphotransferase family enzyme